MKNPFAKQIACQEWVELVTAYLDGALPRRMERAVNRHLAACADCQEYLDQMRRSLDLAGALPDDPVPGDVVDALTAAFAELGADGDPGTG